MTATQSPPIPFGRYLGAASRSARALLDDVLAAEATTYETWIAFNLLAAGAPNVPRDELQRNLALALQMNNGAAVSQLLGQLELVGWLHTLPTVEHGKPPLVEMTTEGAGHYQRLFAVVSQRSAQVLADVDPEDLQTTIRVLGTFREQADALLSA